MTIFGLTIKPMKEARKDLEMSLQRGQDLVRWAPTNYPNKVSQMQPEKSRGSSSRRIVCTFKKRLG
jgi:hypothetical protein